MVGFDWCKVGKAGEVAPPRCFSNSVKPYRNETTTNKTAALWTHNAAVLSCRMEIKGLVFPQVVFKVEDGLLYFISFHQQIHTLHIISQTAIVYIGFLHDVA